MAVAIMGFLFMLFVGLMAVSTLDTTPVQPRKTTTKRNHSINTYGKYKQAKRYYGYSRGRKLW